MARLVRNQHDAQSRLAPVLAELAGAHGRLAAAEARVAAPLDRPRTRMRG